MKVKVREAGNVRIVDVAGRFALGSGAGAVEKSVRELLESGRDRILINLSDVEMIDSAALAELKSCSSSVQEKNGVLHLVKPRKEIAFKPVVVTNLVLYFKVFDDELVAVGSFASESDLAHTAIPGRSAPSGPGALEAASSGSPAGGPGR